MDDNLTYYIKFSGAMREGAALADAVAKGNGSVDDLKRFVAEFTKKFGPASNLAASKGAQN